MDTMQDAYYSPLAWNEHSGAAVCALAVGAAASPRPPKSILEIPCPIVEPTATLPAVAAIWPNRPGCLGCPAWDWACDFAGGGAGRETAAGDAATVDDEREPEGAERPPPPLDRWIKVLKFTDG